MLRSKQLFSVATLALCVAGSVAVAAKPNIVLCMTDDQGWGDVGYNGHGELKTPVLDEMAASGLRLDRFYAAAPVCSPTRASVLTGRHPNRMGCFSWGRTLRPEEVTLAEALKQAGYVSGHFGKWHLGPVWAESPVSPGGSGFDAWVSAPNFYENSPLMSDRGQVIETDGESSMVTVEAALRFIDEATASGKPFVAVIWFGNPHTPHVGVDALKAKYAEYGAKKQNYYAELAGVDLAMGRMRAALREKKIADETLVWFTSDNGSLPPGSTGGLRGRKGTLWEGGVRVPCVMEWPARIQEARRSAVAGSTCDIYPTLLQIAGVEVEHQPPLDGVSLLPLIDGKMDARPKPMGFWVYPAGGNSTRADAILAEMREAQQAGEPVPKQLVKRYEYAPPEPHTDENLPGHATWVDGDWKLHKLKGEKFELYHLGDDADETTDLAAKEGERVKVMAAALEAWQRSVVRSLNGEDYRK